MTNQKGRALVTGGAGLIGSHLVDLLIERGYEVVILDSLEPQTHPHGKPDWLNPKAEFIQGSVLNDADIRHALENVQFVFHQAAFGGFTEKISKYIDVNVNGTTRIFEQIATGKFSVRKVVVASSQAVYAEGAYVCSKDGRQFPPVRPLNQLKQKQWELRCPQCSAPLKPELTSEDKRKDAESPYALSKEFEERVALTAGKQFGIPVVALRYGVTYGPRQSIFNPYTGVVSIFSTRILNDLSPLVYEDGDQTRDFVYVKDVAKANLFVMESENTSGQVFNVGTGKATTVAGLAQTLAGIYGRSIKPEIPGQFRFGDVRHILLNTDKLKALGFQASTALAEGLQDYTAWIKTRGKVEEYFSTAYENLKKSQIVMS